MEIILTKSLIEYMKNKNKKELTIDLPMRKVCCSGPYLPFVRFGKAKRDGYVIKNDHGYTVYVNPEVKYSKSKIHVGTRKFLLVQEIYCFDPETVCVCGGYVKE
jgi:hypothetical protein